MSKRPTPFEDSRTVFAEERLKEHPFYQPPEPGEATGQYQGRPIIGRKTRINGGVYVGASAREAIVVDDQKSSLLPSHFTVLRDEILKDSPLRLRWRKRMDPQHALHLSYAYTQQIMPYSSEVSDGIQNAHPADKKISLGLYIAKGGGVCRHQALLSGYFVEKMIDEGYLDGEVHVERNTTVRGAHAWVRYTPPKGEAMIIDPARHFIGPESEAHAASWPYVVPE
jgi:hypothetical protein